MDILDPFLKVIGQHKFLLVVVDYSTKWVEVEAVASITENDVRKYMWNIITRFGVPKTMVFDNDRQFTDKMLDQYASDGIQMRFMVAVMPQTNA